MNARRQQNKPRTEKKKKAADKFGIVDLLPRRGIMIQTRSVDKNRKVIVLFQDFSDERFRVVLRLDRPLLDDRGVVHKLLPHT